MNTSGSAHDFLDAIIAKCSSEMPRTCSNCKKLYPTFKDFILGTQPIGAPQSYFKAGQDPIGVLSYVNCPCGGTMVLKCEQKEMQEIFRATVMAQAVREGKTPGLILTELREAVRAKVLSS